MFNYYNYIPQTPCQILLQSPIISKSLKFIPIDPTTTVTTATITPILHLKRCRKTYRYLNLAGDLAYGRAEVPPFPSLLE